MIHLGGPGSNPGVSQILRLVTLKPLKLHQCTLYFQKPPVFVFLTREVKSIAAFSVHDILSGMYIGLLNKIKNVCKHSKDTVYIFLLCIKGDQF